MVELQDFVQIIRRGQAATFSVIKKITFHPLWKTRVKIGYLSEKDPKIIRIWPYNWNGGERVNRNFSYKIDGILRNLSFIPENGKMHFRFNLGGMIWVSG
jgi:hypothetical protein